MKQHIINLWAKAFTLAYYSDLHGVRLMLAMAELLWAVTLLLPGNTFDRPTYQVMSQVMSEPAWGLIFLLMGTTQLSILLSGIYHDRFPVWFSAINSSYWWFVCISMILSVSPFPAAISGEVALAVGASWVWVRSGYQTDRRSCNG